MLILREFVILMMTGWIRADILRCKSTNTSFAYIQCRWKTFCGEIIRLAESKSTSALVSFQHSPSVHKEGCEFFLDIGVWSHDVSWNRLNFEILDFQNNGNSCVTFGRIPWYRGSDWRNTTSPIPEKMLDSYCGTNKPALHTSISLDKYNSLYINFKTFDFANDGNVFFKFFANVFHADGSCSKYKCENGRCIPKDLKCSEYNPCGDHSDCEDGVSVGLIFGIVVGCIAAIVIGVFIVKYWRDRRKWKSDEDEMTNMDQSTRTSQGREPQQSLLVENGKPPPPYEERYSA